MKLAVYLTDLGAHFAPRVVDIAEPKSVALLALANRALAQAVKPYVDRIAKIIEGTEGTDDVKLAAVAGIEEKREASPAVVAARAEVARLSGIVEADRAKQRIVMFAPVMPDGTGAATHRWTVDAATLEAWRAETDSDKRAAILASTNVVDGKSNVGITRSQHALLATVYPGRDDLRAALARGELIIPQDRGDKGAATKRTKRTETEATDAALDFLFANVAPVETTDETDKPAGN